MARLSTSAGTIHRDVHGPDGAPALVLLHAFPLSSRLFDDFVAAIGPAARTIAVDLPGLGASTADGEPSVAAMARGVLEVLDHLEVESAVVLGISTGGYVALELAGVRPDLVRALVLGSTTPRVGPPDVPQERRELAQQLVDTRDLSLLHDSVDDGLGPTAQAERPELRDRLLEVIDRNDPDGVAWVARALAARRDTSEVLTGLAAPVLCLFGAEDEATPPARAHEIAELHGPGTDVVVLPATGHLTVLERPERTATEVQAFLARLAPLDQPGS